MYTPLALAGGSFIQDTVLSISFKTLYSSPYQIAGIHGTGLDVDQGFVYKPTPFILLAAKPQRQLLPYPLQDWVCDT